MATVVICFCLNRKQTNKTENNQQRLGLGKRKKKNFLVIQSPSEFYWCDVLLQVLSAFNQTKHQARSAFFSLSAPLQLLTRAQFQTDHWQTISSSRKMTRLSTRPYVFDFLFVMILYIAQEDRGDLTFWDFDIQPKGLGTDRINKKTETWQELQLFETPHRASFCFN